MKKRIKLRDVTKEEFYKWTNQNCFIKKNKCEKCIFENVNCCSVGRNWIDYKNIFNDKFLDQEIEIEVTDILDKVEKEYLSNIIKPFRNRVTKIKKDAGNSGFEYIRIYLESIADFINSEVFTLPFFKENTMYKGMEPNRVYTPEELGL